MGRLLKKLGACDKATGVVSVEDAAMEGDQHKMREALVFCLRIIGENGIRGNVFIDDIREAHRAITAALAARPRNCDVGTADEHTQRFAIFCASHQSATHGICDSNCPFVRCPTKVKCLFGWAQMPYSEGDK